ncbi:O-antigen ligase family protein [Pseudomonas sp.]|uniref:O-antigen ligase family protein n=1 Tax=Pseudomonas sp. TaxID=306 RepID=UPI0028ADF60F|nr:O-antigen ligase family protein [Pseudomonas sp.]
MELNPRYIPLSFFLILIGGGLFFKLKNLSWHDSQRIIEIFLFFLSSTILFFSKNSIFFIGRKELSLVFFFFGLGLLSCVFSRQPIWGVTEIALFLGCFGIYFYISAIKQHLSEATDLAFLSLVLIIVIAKIVQFFSSYVAACLSGEEVLDVWLLTDGFSNIRHYGQLQTFILSVFSFFVFRCYGGKLYSIFAFVLMVLFWVVVIACGTRGTWLGIFCAGSILFFISNVGRVWFVIQTSAASAALIAYFCMFHVITHVLQITVLQSASNRITTSLSSRDVIWEKAVEMIIAHPFLGIGPMHFADTYNPIAAHPHQAFLQIACEWGIPALIVLIILLIKFFKFSVVTARSADLQSKGSILQVCLIAGILASLVQSMVDGVIVMPYSQLWLMIFAGWLNGSYISEHAEIGKRCASTLKILLLGSSLFLVFVVLRDINHLDWMKEGGQKNHWGYFQPRFWSQGIIAAPESKF